MDRKEQQKKDFQELKHKQITEGHAMIEANKDDSVQIREDEQGFYHVKTTKVRQKLDGSGETERYYKVITLSQKDYQRMKGHKGQGFAGCLKVEVLHDPTKVLTPEQKEAKAAKDALKAARAEYKEVVGKGAGNTWDIATIKAKQEEAEAEANAETANA